VFWELKPCSTTIYSSNVLDFLGLACLSKSLNPNRSLLNCFRKQVQQVASTAVLVAPSPRD